MDVAAVQLDGDGLVVYLSGDHAPLDDLLEKDKDGSLRGEARHLEDVCARLDRAGVHWAVGGKLVPRLWAERLFAELPPHLHARAYLALLEVFTSTRSQAAADHAAVLQAAWTSRGRSIAAMGDDVELSLNAKVRTATNPGSASDEVTNLAERCLTLTRGRVLVTYMSSSEHLVEEEVGQDQVNDCVTRLYDELGPAEMVSLKFGAPHSRLELCFPDGVECYEVTSTGGVSSRILRPPAFDIWDLRLEA